MFKDKIRAKRTEMGLSQYQLALRLGVTPPCVAGWETGRTVPKTEMLVKLAEVFGCTLDDLYEKKEAGNG